MARLKEIAFVLFSVSTCAMSPEPPDFNGCWAFFPPGPQFDEQIADYVKSDDPNVILASCLAPYKLNEETCQQFKKVGAGAWPEDVRTWCFEQYGIELDQL